jgi:hypothetical protein
VRQRAWLLLAAVLVVGALSGLVLARQRLDAASSTLSRGGTGWLAARLYLEQRRGAPVVLDRQQDVGSRPGRGTLVVSFPWQSRHLEVDVGLVLTHLAHGGDVLIGYAGEIAPSGAEDQLLSALGVRATPLQAPPLAPWSWRRVAAQPWPLRLAPRVARASVAAGADSTLSLRRPHWLPVLSRASALLLGPEDHVVAAAWRFRQGRVVVIPAELICNARLAEPGHAALLETLRRELAGPWLFDEYHHGLGTGDGGEAGSTMARRGLDLLLLQLLLIYLVATLALARRLGPAWREAPTLAGSAGGFLLRLGALHHRLGHHADGAALLVRRARELDRRLPLDAGVLRLAGRDDEEALVDVGQAVARLQRR